MYSVYAVYNRDCKKLYIGQTKDLKERIRLHNSKTFYNSYTSRFGGEWVLVYSEGSNNRSEALIREKQLKSYRGREFIKKYIPR